MLSELLGRYLSDDLAVLSVDLRDAPPLCQEGEDLIQLQEEDSDTEKSYLCQNRHPQSSDLPFSSFFFLLLLV